MSTFSSISHTFRHNLRTAGYDVPLGHCQQAIAAVLGFKSLAAFQASDLSSTDLLRVRHVLIDDTFVRDRIKDLGSFPDAALSLKELISALKIPAFRAAIHASIDEFQDTLQEELEQFAEQNSDVISAMGLANYDGIDEFYLPFDLEGELANADTEISIDAQGHIGLSADIERPFSGNKVNIDAVITLERFTSAAFSHAEYFVEKAGLDHSWSNDDDDEPPSISFAQTLMEELGISMEEAEELVDVEPQANTNDDGSIIYSHTLDFEDVAVEPLRSKLIKKRGSLQIEVPAHFFDNVQPDIY